MKFQKLKFIEILYGLVLVAIGYVYIRIDQFFIPEKYLFLAFGIFIFIELFGYFIVLNPGKAMRLSNSISLIIGVVTLILIVIQHIIIRFDISTKSLFIFIIAVGTPYLVGSFYYLFSFKNRIK